MYDTLVSGGNMLTPPLDLELPPSEVDLQYRDSENEGQLVVLDVFFFACNSSLIDLSHVQKVERR